MLHDGVWKTACQAEKWAKSALTPPLPTQPPPSLGGRGLGAAGPSALWKTPSDSIYRTW